MRPRTLRSWAPRLRNGTLTKGQAATLHQDDHQIRQEERDMPRLCASVLVLRARTVATLTDTPLQWTMHLLNIVVSKNHDDRS
jgi:hypothetical protein